MPLYNDIACNYGRGGRWGNFFDDNAEIFKECCVNTAYII
jgi:hypothetical protein